MRIALVAAFALGACGVPDASLVDGSVDGTIGGTVTGMVGTGLVLQNLGGDNAPVTADGTFVFARPIATGMSYSVTVKTQPSAPSQMCTVTDGTGIVGSKALQLAPGAYRWIQGRGFCCMEYLVSWCGSNTAE